MRILISSKASPHLLTDIIMLHLVNPLINPDTHAENSGYGKKR